MRIAAVRHDATENFGDFWFKKHVARVGDVFFCFWHHLI
jgi:hypothetical protein